MMCQRISTAYESLLSLTARPQYGESAKFHFELLTLVATVSVTHVGQNYKTHITMLPQQCHNYTVSGKKRDQNVFCNISYKTRAILMKSGV